jgi:site-specific recombinase XerD
MRIANLTNSFILARQADGRAPRTILDYRRTLDPFARWCARKHITHLTRDAVRRYVATLYATGWSVATVGIYVRNLRAFLRWLHEEGRLAENLAKAVRPPKSAARLEDLPADHELRALLDACRDDAQAARDRALILVLLDTGLRLGELVAMRRDALHLDGDIAWFQIYSPKTGQGHFSFLGSASSQALAVYLQTRKDGELALWLGVRGPLTPTGVYKALRRRALKAGISPGRVHPHAFRKLFATLWTQNGGDRTRLKALGGWRTDAMLDRYVLLSARAQLAHGHRQYGPVDHLLG